MIYVIGDSHAKVFSEMEFFVQYKKAYTAHNLKYKLDIPAYIGNKVKPGDKIIFAFGELDCRNHIHYQFRKRQEKQPYWEIVDETVCQYQEFLSGYQEYDFAVYNIVPAGCWADGWSQDHYGGVTRKERIFIYNLLHEGIKDMCWRNTWKCIDAWPLVVGPNGFTLSIYRDDEVHLNKLAYDKVIKKLVEEAFSVSLKHLDRKEVPVK